MDFKQLPYFGKIKNRQADKIDGVRGDKMDKS